MPRSRRTFGRGREPTVDEFCLAYLADRVAIPETSPLAGQLTQEQIAAALGKPRANVSRTLRNLGRRGYLDERSIHVRGGKRRKTAYFLSGKGLRAAKELRDSLEARLVRVAFPDGREEDHPLGSVPALVGRRAPIADILLSTSNGRLDADALEARLEGGGRAVFLDLEGVPPARRFVGRADELRWIETFLASPDAVAVAITGLAGMGKTALAREFVRRLGSSRSVSWHTLTGETTALELMSRVVRFLSRQTFRPLSGILSVAGDGEDRIAGVLAAELAKVGPILVLDDLQKASPAVTAWVARLLAACRGAGRTRFLLVARTRPEVYDRSIALRDVALLEVPLAPLPEEAATEFLRGRLPPAQVPVAVRAAGGNPLFLQLVAERGMPVPAAKRETERFVEEQVVRDLRPGELRVLEIAAVCEGAAPRDLLLEAGARRDLDGLQDREILREASPGLYAVHDVVRDAALGRAEAARLRELHGAAGAYFAERGGREAVPQAVRHLSRAGDVARAAALLIESVDPLILAGLAAPLAGLARPLVRKANPEVRADLWLVEGKVAEATGSWDDAMRAYRTAEGGGGTRVSAEARLGLGRILLRRRLHEEALEVLATARDAFEALGSPGHLSEALYFMGRTEGRLGRFELAEALLERSRAIAFSAGDRTREGLALFGLGMVADERRDYPEAARLASEGARLLERSGAIVELAKALTGLAGALQAAKDYDRALEIQERAVEMARRVGDPYVLATAVNTLAITLNRMERSAEALEPARESVRLGDLIGDLETVGRGTTLVGRILYKLGDRDGAIAQWSEAERRIARIPAVATRAELLAGIAMNGYFSGERALALRLIHEARERAGESGHPALIQEIEEFLRRIESGT